MSGFMILQDLVGQEVGVSDWIEMGQYRISEFADVTEDHQFIHIDEVKAKKYTPFGGTIAHGFLTLSMLSKFAEQGIPKVPGVKMGLNYGFNKVRFLSPVPSGSKLRGRFTLQSVEEKQPGQILCCYDAVAEIEGADKPAYIAEWLSLLFF